MVAAQIAKLANLLSSGDIELIHPPKVDKIFDFSSSKRRTDFVRGNVFYRIDENVADRKSFC
jgi:hypothetical protein